MPTIKTKTRVIIDSGKEYVLNVHPEEFVAQVTNEAGVLHQGFVHYAGLSIIPTHISSIEDVEYKE